MEVRREVQMRGSVALVTGGTRGIGLAVAGALAEVGANVMICGRDAARAADVARDLDARFGGTVRARACDIRRFADVERLVASTIEEFGRIDVLVNNAGVGAFAPISELLPATWHEVIETNLNGVYYACHAAIPHMISGGGGWIINIGSLAGRNPFAGGAAYNASKFGLLGFTEALMLDVRQMGIRVTCIMPGSVETEFSGPSSSSAPGDWKLQPEDVAHAVLDVLAYPPRALPSRIEMRPTRPPKK